MHADDFEKQVGMTDNGTPSNMTNFSNIMNELRVVARAKPSHKNMIV